jgi:hypothetical protein
MKKWHKNEAQSLRLCWEHFTNSFMVPLSSTCIPLKADNELNNRPFWFFRKELIRRTPFSWQGINRWGFLPYTIRPNGRIVGVFLWVKWQFDRYILFEKKSLLPPYTSQPVRLAGGWWLVLVCSERRVLLAGCWWLVCSERKVLLAGGW